MRLVCSSDRRTGKGVVLAALVLAAWYTGEALDELENNIRPVSFDRTSRQDN